MLVEKWFLIEHISAYAIKKHRNIIQNNCNANQRFEEKSE